MEWNRHKTGAIFSLFLLIGCSVEQENTAPLPVTSITISPQQGNVALGATLKMSALGVTSAGTVGEAVSVSLWQSGDPSVATIDSNGVISPIGLGVTTIIASSGTFRGTATIGIVAANAGTEDLNITGHAFYEDKHYNENGFTGQLANNPIRQAVVELIAIDGFITLASGTTTENGTYQFSQIKNNTRRGGVYVRVLAKTAEESFNPMTIQDNDTDKNLSFVYGRPLDDSVSGSFPSDQIIAMASGIGGAFNILDAFVKGSEFIQKIDPCAPQNLSCKPILPPTLLTGYWEQGVQSSTSYEGTNNTIFINGGFRQPGATVVTGDTDEYDDTILLHEYGHFVATRLAHDDSPGGQHILLDDTQDIRLAWSEGWATFFASAVLGSPLIVDTKDKKTLSKFNIETLSTASTSVLYTTNEAAISAILWDLFDATPSQDDDPAITIGFDKIWKGFTGMVGAATMESFFISFLNQSPESTDAFQEILQRAKIELFPDTAETITLPLNTHQHHTLYRSGNPFLDEDIIPFSVNANQTYNIRTLNLTNGADTFLTIQNSGSVLRQNDNADGRTYIVKCDPCPINNKTTLASSIITFQSTITGQFFAHVKRSPDAPDSTGMTGSYDILLTSP